jgi:hypothetical protein
MRDIDQTSERDVPASDTALRLLTAYLDALFAGRVRKSIRRWPEPISPIW